MLHVIDCLDLRSQCDYTNVPAVVLTPLEYAACGLSEEKATLTFGEASIEVHTIADTHTQNTRVPILLKV